MCMRVWYVCIYGVSMCVDTCDMWVETQSWRQKYFSALLHLTHGVGVPQLNPELIDGLVWLAGSFQGSSVFIFLVLERLPFIWIQKIQVAIYMDSEDLSELFTPVTSALATERSPQSFTSHFCWHPRWGHTYFCVKFTVNCSDTS